MKTLVIYYSLEGNTRFIAETINKELKGELLEIKPKVELQAKGFKKYLWGGKQVLFKDKPEIEEISIDFSKYELIVFGTPIWASRYAPVYNTFFNKFKIEGKKIALFCCHGGGGEGKAFDGFKEQLKGNNFVGEISLRDPLNKDTSSAVEKVKEWTKDINAKTS